MAPKHHDALDFLDILADLRIDYALIGGVAVGFWSQERFTKDIDFTVALNEALWLELEAYLKNSGDVRIDLIATDKENAPGLPYLIRLKFKEAFIDLIVSLTDFQKSLLQRKIPVDFSGKKIFIASPEDIIVSKLIANRSQDLVDIESLVTHLENLDSAYIEKWAREWDALKTWTQISRR